MESIMSDKQSLIQAVDALPDAASWPEITATMLDLLARRSAISNFAKLYRTQLTADHLSEYINPKRDVSLESVVAELEARSSTG